MVRNPGAWEFRKKGMKYDLNKLYMDLIFSKDLYVPKNYKKQKNATILKYDFVVDIIITKKIRQSIRHRLITHLIF